MRRTPLHLLVLWVSVCLVAGSAFGQTRDTGKQTIRKTTAKTKKNPYLIDINSAPKIELMTLPGIGDADAQKMIDGRPYRTKSQLVQKNIIPQATYEKIADSISAKQGTNAAKKRPAWR
jgi:DNA uptake protein ComE-like DNA-binding protein